MSLSKEKKNRISEVIKNILLVRIGNFPQLNHQNRNAPFHDLILTAFEEQLKPIKISTPYLVAIASWMHGLNTSLGTGFESLAHILSGGYKRTFANNFTLKVKKSQANNIGRVIVELKSGIKPDLIRENEIIFKFNRSEQEVNALDFTVDNYTEKEGLIEGIELKSVRPNSGEGRGEKEKILYAKAAFKKANPTKTVKYYIGFPFDPTSTSPKEFDKERFFKYLVEFKKFFSPEEVIIVHLLFFVSILVFPLYYLISAYQEAFVINSKCLAEISRGGHGIACGSSEGFGIGIFVLSMLIIYMIILTMISFFIAYRSINRCKDVIY